MIKNNFEVSYEFAYLNEQGKREYSEDSIGYYPKKLKGISNEPLLFLVCDGVGGLAKGEVASKMLAESILEYYKEYKDVEKNINSLFFEKALRFAEKKMKEYVDTNLVGSGMATTLTLLYISKYGAIIGHIGDSRVYFNKSDEVFYFTRDHSLLNDFIDLGILKSKEEIDGFERKHEITRAVHGANRPAEIEFTFFDKVSHFDNNSPIAFLLCTDGILEAVTEDDIKKYSSSNLSPEEIVNEIKGKCDLYSNDNFSCIWLKINYLKGLIPNKLKGELDANKKQTSNKNA